MEKGEGWKYKLEKKRKPMKNQKKTITYRVGKKKIEILPETKRILDKITIKPGEIKSMKNKKKIRITTKNTGKYFNHAIEVMTEDAVKELSHQIEMFIRSQIRPKPWWFPSKKIWKWLACKFLEIDIK